MKKMNLLSGTLGIAALLVSCIKDDPAACRKNEVVYANVSLTEAHSPYIRSEGERINGTEAEGKITTLGIFVFNEDGTPDERTSYLSLVKEGDIYDNTKTYPLPVTLGKKTFLVVANVKVDTQLAAINSPTTLEEVRKMLNGVVLNDGNSRKIPDTGIPMGGETTQIISGPVHLPTSVIIGLSRNFSKLEKLVAESPVEVKLSYDDLKTIFDETIKPETKPSFELTKYYVINGMTQSYAFLNYNSENKETAAWNHWKLASPNDFSRYAGSTYGNDKQPVKVYSGKEDDTVWISAANTKAVFVYENSPQEVTSPWNGYHKKSVTSMILEGKLSYDEGEGVKTATRYWRLNIASQYNYKIFRNVIYTVKLGSINSKGYTNPKDAEEDEEEVIPKEPGVIATITIEPWRQIDVTEGV